MLQKLLGLVCRPPVPFALGTLLLLCLVWFGGGLLQSGYGWPSTFVLALTCGFVVAFAVGFVALRAVRARKKARAIEEEIKNQGRAQAAMLPPASQGEIQALQQRFDEALESLKSSKLGRGALYAMPWFVIIGPPGSGKTTAITESGLNFPFMKGPNQKRGIRGLGGTRNCDWWFTDQSILLDTAGRYTTEAEDHDEWLAFLGMLKKARKQKPINGAIVALSIADVLSADEEGLERHATTIRQRIDELVKQLEVVFPVYLMLTKCDLLDGFVEFFASMSKEERAQVWGTTFEAGGGGDEMHDRFGAEFDLICQRVDEERLRLLVADRPGGQQQKILSLSLQLRAAKRKLGEFVRLLTQPNPYSDASELRGVYLTSGTQEGAPIDLVLQKLSRAFGLEARPDADPLGAAEPKSYFIRDLFTQVIYADRELAHSSSGVQRRRELLRKVVVFGSIAAALALGVMSLITWIGTRGLLGEFERAAMPAPDIDRTRTAAPDEAEQRRLDAMRDRYLELQSAYSATSLLGPGRATVVKAMTAYAAAARSAFLEPAGAFVERKLEDYVKGDNGLDFAANSQLVTVYGTLDGEYVPYDDSLRTALQQRSLWRWSPAELGVERTTASNTEEARHLEAFLAARRFDPTPWILGSNKTLLGRAREKLRSGSQTTNVIDEILRQNAAARGATEGDLTPLVVKKLEEKSSTKVEVTKALEQEISALRKTQVLSETAAIRLLDTTSLVKTIDSLNDVSRPESKPLQTFSANLEVLRKAGAAPRPGIGNDAVVASYADALKDIAGVRTSLDALARSGRPGGYVLPSVEAGALEVIGAFVKEWSTAQTNVARKVETIAELMKTAAGESTAPTTDAIASSLRGMLNSIVEAVAREARAEMLQHWQQKVGTDLATYAEQFPSHDNAETDFNLAKFVDLFRPQGRIDQELAVLTRLRGIAELAPFLGLDHPFADLVTRVHAIQTACFDPAAPQTARIQFHIAKINRTDPVEDVVLTIASGNEVSQQSGSPTMIRNTLRTWTIGQAGAMLRLETSVVQAGNKVKLTVPPSGSSQSAWGLLRVLAAGTLERLGNDARVSYELDYTPTDGSPAWKARGWLQFEPEGVQNPLTPRFFHLEPPPYIFQTRDQ
ncbi:MAG: type VI secretion system membrane subunit TssM [Planctomycetota bacterium]